MVKKGGPDKFTLDGDRVESFRKLIQCIRNPPVLALQPNDLYY